MNALPDGLRLIISGDDSVTCQLCAGSDGVFRGRWLRHERPLIELVPLDKAAARPLRQDSRTHASAAAADDAWRRIAGDYLCQGLGKRPEKLHFSPNGRIERGVIDNGGGYYCHHPLVTVIYPGSNIGVSGAWNELHRRAAPHPLILMNDDVLPSRGTIMALIDSPGDFITALPGRNAWSCFLQRERVWEEIGDYDERFWPAYYEDNDYRRRMENAGLDFFCVDTGAAHQSDSTKRRLSSADAAELERRIALNHAYFIQKWGGPPWAEQL